MKSLIVLLFAIPALASLNESKHYGRFYVSAEPSEAELIQFKKEKVSMVVDLRNFDELGTQGERATAAKVGLPYSHVSYDAKAETISPDVIAGIDKIIKETGDTPVLLFCKSGNRASSYVAIHLVRHKKMPVDEAIKIAKGLGLSEKMEAKVRAYLR